MGPCGISVTTKGPLLFTKCHILLDSLSFSPTVLLLQDALWDTTEDLEVMPP